MLKRRGGKEVKCLVLWELEGDHCGKVEDRKGRRRTLLPLPLSPILRRRSFPLPQQWFRKQTRYPSSQPPTEGRRPAGGKVNGYLIFAQLCREEETQIYTKVAWSDNCPSGPCNPHLGQESSIQKCSEPIQWCRTLHGNSSSATWSGWFLAH